MTIGFHGGLSDRTVYLRYFCSLSPAARTAHERLVHICFAYSERETVLVADLDMELVDEVRKKIPCFEVVEG